MGGEGSKIAEAVGSLVSEGLALGKAIKSKDMAQIKDATLSTIGEGIELVGERN